MRRILVLLSTLAALAGCATSDRLVDARSARNPSAGYVAGHFTLGHYPFVTAFVLSNIATGAEYILPFTTRRNFDGGAEETTLIAVPPGSYRVRQWIVFNVNFGPAKGWGRDFTADVPEGILTRTIDVSPGEVLFLGSFAGDTTWTAGLTSVTRGRWNAQRISVAGAKQALSRAFPNFSQAPFHCLACIE